MWGMLLCLCNVTPIPATSIIVTPIVITLAVTHSSLLLHSAAANMCDLKSPAFRPRPNQVKERPRRAWALNEPGRDQSPRGRSREVVKFTVAPCPFFTISALHLVGECSQGRREEWCLRRRCAIACKAPSNLGATVSVGRRATLRSAVSSRACGGSVV